MGSRVEGTELERVVGFVVVVFKYELYALGIGPVACGLAVILGLILA